MAKDLKEDNAAPADPPKAPAADSAIGTSAAGGDGAATAAIIPPSAETKSPAAETKAAKPSPAPHTPPVKKAKPAPTATASAPSIHDVLSNLLPATKGHRSRLPNVRLNPVQAEFQHRLYETLKAKGLKLRHVGDVYGWLLDQAAASL